MAKKVPKVHSKSPTKKSAKGNPKFPAKTQEKKGRYQIKKVPKVQEKKPAKAPKVNPKYPAKKSAKGNPKYPLEKFPRAKGKYLLKVNPKKSAKTA